MELAPKHQVWLAGRDVGQVPFDIEGRWARLLLIRLVMRVIFHRVLTIRTPMGRKARPQMIAHGGPLVRLKRAQLRRAGVLRAARVVGAQDGLPVLEDGRVLDVANVVWAAGFDAGFSWIDLPIFTAPPAPSGRTPDHAPASPYTAPASSTERRGCTSWGSISSTRRHRRCARRLGQDVIETGRRNARTSS